jgi:hypothetical protein
MFFSDHRSTENPRQFLESIEASFIAFPGISEAEKCLRFYNLCRLGSDAEEWYETLQECNSDTTTWAQLVAEFCYKWRWSFPRDTHDNPIYSTKPTYLKNTVGIAITTSATATIPAPTNPATTAIHETTTTIPVTNTTADPAHETATTQGLLNYVTDAQCVTAATASVQVQTEAKWAPTATPMPSRAQQQTELTTTTTNLNTANEQQDDEEPGVEREKGREGRTERGEGVTE